MVNVPIITLICKKVFNCLKLINVSNKLKRNMIRPIGNKEYHSSVLKNSIIRKIKIIPRLILKISSMLLILIQRPISLLLKNLKPSITQDKISLIILHQALKAS